MKNYTITSKEYELMCDKLHSLENENSKLKGYIEGLEKQLTIPVVSQRSELLPEFLMKNLDGKIITSVIGSTDVTKEWNEYLGNCG